jgi:hypothetical protein
VIMRLMACKCFEFCYRTGVPHAKILRILRISSKNTPR